MEQGGLGWPADADDCRFQVSLNQFDADHAECGELALRREGFLLTLGSPLLLVVVPGPVGVSALVGPLLSYVNLLVS
jgi:hypothetical protein